MKVLYCINGTYNSGGMERVLMTKANYLADVMGYDVTIVTSQQKGRPNFYHFSPLIKFYDLGINYEEDRNYGLLKRTIHTWHKKKKHKQALTELLNTIRPDICISMFDYEFDFLYKIKDGSKKVLEFHFCKEQKLIEAPNTIMRIIQYIRVNWIWQEIVRHYDKFVVLTEEDKKAWKNLDNTIVIRNPIPDIPLEQASLNVKRVLSVGRISYQKGFERLLKAWALIPDTFKEWTLTICGNGDSTELQNLSKTLNIDSSVIFKPATPKISEEYLNCSIYAMSSRYEGLPMVLMEAMSYGIPIVSFDCPCGPKELIQNHETGSIVHNGDIAGLASELEKWMKNEQKRKRAGEKARTCASQYVQDKIMQQWITLFNSLLLQ